jgi:cellulose biosynthesis protein BcsQ
LIKLALYSMKGGVGKTTTSVNLAYEASRDGFRTILCDLDPQGAASYFFRIRPARKLGPRRLIDNDARVLRAVRGTDYDLLDVLPSSMSLRNLDIALDRASGSRKRLRNTFKTFASDYDLMVIDCAPGITLVSENVFRAADFVAIPCIPTTLSVLTLKKLVKFYRKNDLDESRLLPFLSMVEPRKKLQRRVMEELEKGEPAFLRTAIPYLAAAERMAAERRPIACFEPSSPAARAYRALWEEIRAIIRAGRESRQGGQK